MSHHEAGHAVIARKLGIGVTYPGARAADAVVPTESAAWQSADDAAMQIAAHENDAMVALACMVAQRRYQGTEGRFVDTLLDDDDDTLNARSAIYNSLCLRTGKPVLTKAGNVTVNSETMAAIRPPLTSAPLYWNAPVDF